MFADLTPSQAKAFVDMEQLYRALQDTKSKKQPYLGGMHWKTIKGRKYLYRTLDGRGTAKSIGPLSEATQALHEQFQARRKELDERQASQQERMDEQVRVVKALRVGAAPRVVAQICRALAEHHLLGRNLIIIGTNALYAYEAMAGVRLLGDVTATQDMDVRFKSQARLTAVARDIGPEGLLGILKRVDKTFEVSQTQTCRAINAAGYMVDLIRQTPKPPWKNEPHNLGEQDGFVATDIPSMNWMLSSPSIRQFVIADNGLPFEMAVPDPRAFMFYKAWLSQQAHREPIKRRRDSAQAKLVAELLKTRLPQFPIHSSEFKAFPLVVLQDLGIN